jgi:hypothetical protein
LLRADLLRSGADLLRSGTDLLRSASLRFVLRFVLLQAEVPSVEGAGGLDQEPLPLELLRFVLPTGLRL